MFRTDERLSVVAALVPPDGYRVDGLLVTTYSLDVTALVAMLAAMTGGRSTEDQEQWSAADVAAGLLGLRSRVVVFAQQGQVRAGRIGRARRLVNLFDQIVVPVSPKRSSFHPKVWLVRFKRIRRGPEPLRYRLICSSRNLTAANTWECGVVLDGVPARSPGTVGRDVARFLRTILRAAGHGGRLANSFVKEVRGVRFEALGRRQRLSFVAQSPEGSSLWRQIGSGLMDEGLLVAPFVSAGFLDRLRQRFGGHLKVVGLQDELDKVVSGKNAALREWLGANGNAFVVLPESAKADLRLDLHAKVLFARKGSAGTTVIGSANGTAAAWGTQHDRKRRNWEAGVMVTGPELLSDFERHFMYEDSRRRRLRPWVQPYQPQKRRAQQLLEDQLDDAQRRFGAVELEIRWQPRRSALILRRRGGVSELPYDPGLFRVRVAPHGLEDPPGAFQDGKRLLAGVELTFKPASESALGSFVLVRLESLRRPIVSREFLIMARVIAPDGWWKRRDQAVLHSVLGDRALMSLIVRLLKGETEAAMAAGGSGRTMPKRHPRGSRLTESVLEPMLRHWATDRTQFDFICDALESLEGPRTGAIGELRELVRRLRSYDPAPDRRRVVT